VEARLDGEDNPLWDVFGIDIVPTVLFFEGGEVVQRLDGKPLVGLDEKKLEKALATFERR
jgi:hypothetical protein